MKTLIKLFIPLCLGIAITACSSMEQPNSESELNSFIEKIKTNLTNLQQ